VNLFVRPAKGVLPAPGFTTRHDGYSLVRWSRGGLEFWAVSDIEAAELNQFREAFEARTQA
jgi:anti-sigma factor RsiW